MDTLKNERIDKVPGTKYNIIQNYKKFSYGIDAILLSEFTSPKGLVVDLGTGTGIIPIRIAGRKKFNKVFGIEIQKEVYNMAKRSVILNGLEDKIEIINMDIKFIDSSFKKASINTVISNPPYMKYDDGISNEDDNFAISRHEIKCDLEDIIKAAEYLLCPLGKLYMVHRPDRLVDILYLMRCYKIEPKRLRLVQSKTSEKPNLALIEGVKHGKAELKVEKPLIVYGGNGDYTKEIMDIYYKEV